MKKSLKFIMIIIVLIIIALLLFRIIKSSTNNHHRPHNDLNVIIAKVTLKPAPLFTMTQGSIEASQSVDIQPQIAGIIQKIGFTPGQTVTKGQLLFQLDPTTYQASLAKAQANLAKDQAQLPTIQNTENRYQTLLQKGYVSTQDYEQIKAQLDAQINMIKSDIADVKEAQAQLDYTHITAPFAGRTGNVAVKQGDLVKPTDTTVLVTINQLQPVFVDFYISQQDLDSLIFYQKKQALTTLVYSEDKKQVLDTGVLTFIDNTVDPDTGMILVKASMPNKNSLLWPGETVKVKLIFTIDENQIAIPTQAVQTGQQGNFVYIIKNNRAFVTPIKILRQIGAWTFIKSGLQVNDAVATLFPPDLQDQSPVHILSTASEGQ